MRRHTRSTSPSAARSEPPPARRRWWRPGHGLPSTAPMSTRRSAAGIHHAQCSRSSSNGPHSRPSPRSTWAQRYAHRSTSDCRLPMTIDTGDGAAWMRAVRLLSNLSQREDTGPLLIDRLVEETVVGLLWASEHSLRPQLQGTSPASVSAFRRGVDLIHAIPEEALTLDSLARYAGVSGRSLQLSFRRELGLSPMKYLKTVRLDRAAEALRETSPCDSFVSEVARRFGFTHLGRFAADYAQRHGEKPSETCRRHS